MLMRENTYVVDEKTSLEVFLRKHCLFFNRVPLEQFLDNDRVLVNSIVVRNPTYLLKEQDVVVLCTPQSFEPPVNEAVAVLYEDAAILVVNKPAPLPLHPAGRHYFNTLTSILVRNGLAKEDALFPVQRLDRETSGVVVFAKTSQLAAKLAKQFHKRNVRKEYVAITRGKVVPKIGLIDAPLAKGAIGEIRDMMYVDPTGLACVTAYELVAGNEVYSVLLLRPETGRRHQIRAHLASLGHPILGDKLYGARPDLFIRFMEDVTAVSPEELLDAFGATRQYLHALRLTFTHPVNSTEMIFFARLPDDMSSFCSKNGLDVSFTR